MEPEQQRLYINEYCAQCGARACLTELEAFWLHSAQPVCPEASPGQLHCAGPCCHGCACVQRGQCGREEGEECDCDCHLERLPLIRDPLPVSSSDASPERCPCSVCRLGLTPTLEHVPCDEGDSEGYWVSNRPRECWHFEGRRNDGRSVISSCYDNADGRNRRLDNYFYTIHVSDCH